MVGTMRGAGWIRGLREAEARQLRSEIDRLERGLIEAANSKAKWNLHEVAHTLRWQKAKLRRLEECLDAMPEGKTASDRS
jgi:DNA-binding NtrC family response regulator